MQLLLTSHRVRTPSRRRHRRRGLQRPAYSTSAPTGCPTGRATRWARSSSPFRSRCVRSRRPSPVSARPVVELRRLRRRVPRALLRVLQRPPVRQVRRDPLRPRARSPRCRNPCAAERGAPWETRRPPPRVGPLSWLMASGMARGASRASCSPAGGQTSRRQRERSGLGCRGRDLEPPLTAAGRTSSTPAAGRRSRPPWRWGWPRCRRSPPTTRLRRLPTVGRRSV